MSSFVATSAGRLSKRYIGDSIKIVSASIVKQAAPLLKQWEKKLAAFLRQASLLRFEAAYATIDFERKGLKRQFDVPDDPQYEVWTFDDEFWRDELGDYRYLLRSECQGQEL